MIISIINNWRKAESKHAKFLFDLVNSKIAVIDRASIVGNKASQFLEDVTHCLIISGKDDILLSISIYNHYLNSFADEVSRQKFIKKIKSIFDYNKFVQKKGNWNAYELCKSSLTRTCPYCNQSYAFTLQTGNRGFRPTLDHYYSKDDYPHLALSLNNLIPSCYTCNSNLKGKKDFFTTPHLNPLWDDENISFSFSHVRGIVNLENDVYTDPDGLIVNINIDNLCDRTNKSIETFLIKERYELVAFEAAAFAKSKLEYLYAKESGVPYFENISEAAITRFDAEKYAQYLLGKLLLGVSNQINDLRVDNIN